MPQATQTAETQRLTFNVGGITFGNTQLESPQDLETVSLDCSIDLEAIRARGAIPSLVARPNNFNGEKDAVIAAYTVDREFFQKFYSDVYELVLLLATREVMDRPNLGREETLSQIRTLTERYKRVTHAELGHNIAADFKLSAALGAQPQDVLVSQLNIQFEKMMVDLRLTLMRELAKLVDQGILGVVDWVGPDACKVWSFNINHGSEPTWQPTERRGSHVVGICTRSTLEYREKMPRRVRTLLKEMPDSVTRSLKIIEGYCTHLELCSISEGFVAKQPEPFGYRALLLGNFVLTTWTENQAAKEVLDIRSRVYDGTARIATVITACLVVAGVALVGLADLRLASSERALAQTQAQAEQRVREREFKEQLRLIKEQHQALVNGTPVELVRTTQVQSTLELGSDIVLVYRGLSTGGPYFTLGTSNFMIYCPLDQVPDSPVLAYFGTTNLETHGIRYTLFVIEATAEKIRYVVKHNE
jgi:hypothetical protein